MVKRVDERFEEILLRDIKTHISEAFLDLEANMRIGEHGTTRYLNKEEVSVVETKANQMKTEINEFIDSQLKRVIEYQSG